jgi:hypothetical protein
MGTEGIDDFREYREQMKERLLSLDSEVIKSIFNLDSNACLDGPLTAMTREEILEIFAVTNLVGGRIVILYTRKSAGYWDVLKKKGS